MRSKPLLTALMVAAIWWPGVTAAPALGQEIVLDLDPARATVHFTLGATLHTVHGSFKLKPGVIRFDPASGKISGDAVADAASGESGDAARDRRMHKSILESERYPEIVFAPDRIDGTVAPQGASQVQVHGMLRIHGAAHEMTLPVQVQIANGQVTVTTHFAIPYVKWGMKNPSTLFLRVSDKVEIDATAHTP
jgi:polyisoprenoid-binding protein YceI